MGPPARGLDLAEYVDAIRREQVAPNGVFALKNLSTDLEPLLERPFVADLLDSAKFVYLTRDDLVAQAISDYIAESSGVWHRDPSGELSARAAAATPTCPTTRSGSSPSATPSSVSRPTGSVSSRIA